VRLKIEHDSVSSNSPVILKYNLAEKEYFDARRAYAAHLGRSSFFFRTMLPVALGAALAGTYATLFAGNLELGLGLWSASACLMIARIFLWKQLARRALEQNPGLMGPFEVELTAAGIQASPELSKWGWFDLKYYETGALFLLLGPASEFLILPKRVFPAGDMLEWIETLRTELRGKGRHENPDASLLKLTATWATGALFVVALFVGNIQDWLRPALKRPVTRMASTSTESTSTKETESATPATLKDLEGRGSVYLVPLGKPQEVLSNDLLSFYRKKYGIQLRVLDPVSLPDWTKDEIREQLIAEELVEAMKRANPQLAGDPNVILIGVTDQDMYISQVAWSYAYNWRQEERFGVVSTARMDPVFEKEPANPKLLEERARKMITKNIGLLYYHLQLSHNYSSVLYGSIDDLDDLDEIGEDFLLSDAQVRAERHLEDGDPCFTIRHYSLPNKARPEAASLTGCSGEVTQLNLEIMEVDLRYGLFLDRRTEFDLPGQMPLRFTRVLRTQDSRSRAFGIGGTHNLNIVPVGNKWPFTWIDLVMADGGRVHFKRSNWGFGYWDAVYTQSDNEGGEFSRSTIHWDWPGWKLVEPSGKTYYFPDGDVQRPEQAALVGIRDRQGNALGLERNEAGNLIHAASSTGGRLNFQYDSRNRITHVQDAGGDRFDYGYDSGGRLASVRDADGRVTQYIYDANNRMTAVTQNGNQILQNEYDEGSRVVRQTLADGRTYTFKYLFDRRGEAVAVDIHDSGGLTLQVQLNQHQYTVQPVRNR
jgi:YD repeat-containing protein